MTPGMQIRLWLRTAARSQVAFAGAVLVAVVALLVASVSQGPTRASNDQALTSSTGGDVSGGATGDGAATTGSSGTTTGPANVPAGPTSTSGSFTTSTGTSTGGGATGGGSSSGLSGSSGGGSTGSSSPAPSSYPITRASDRGVNGCGTPATCVKVGFLVSKIGGLAASGFALGLRTDIQKVITAYVNEQNKHGGLDGRPIVPVFRTVDPVDNNDQLQACTQLTQDDKVFAVIDTASLIFANSQTCFIKDNKTPLIHGYAESEAFMESGRGYDVSETRSLDRIAIEWADEIGKLRFLTGGEHVGILEDNCEPSHSVVQKLLIGGIKKYRPASIKTYESDCTAASAQAQPPALQQQMCIDGVTHVLLATSFVAAQTFLQSADAGACATGARHYRYMASDYSLLAGDLFTRNFNQRQFDGSLAISNEFTGITAVSAATKACSKTLTDAGLPGVDNSYPNADATAICDYFRIFVGTALKVGPNLTRAAWAQQVQTVGEFDGSYSPKSVFATNKTNGGELVHSMVWAKSCGCYHATGPLHQGKG